MYASSRWPHFPQFFHDLHRGLDSDGGRRDIRELLVARSHNYTPKPYEQQQCPPKNRCLNILEVSPLYASLATYYVTIESFNVNFTLSEIFPDTRKFVCTVCFLDRWPPKKCRVTFDISFAHSFLCPFTWYPQFCCPW